jgi:hypothetical protein
MEHTMTARLINMVTDSTGRYTFEPASCAHYYTYNTDGDQISDLAFERATNRYFLKTYLNANGKATYESDWVLQAPTADAVALAQMAS